MSSATSVISRLSAALEHLVQRIENASVLDPAADLGQKLTSRLPAGAAKDLLSGTAMGHPLHPALVAVPIGAFAGAAVLDATDTDPAASRRLIALGLLSALPTAVSGLSDWGDTEGAERRVGVVHALCNTVGLGLLTASWWRRRCGENDGAHGLALAGLGIIGFSGWLGGHLAYALGVGVDTTAFQTLPTDWTDACAADDLNEGEPHGVMVDGTPVLLVRDRGSLRALSDRCSHRGAPLHEGTVTDGCVQCPWHGSRFDLADGSVLRGPATRPQATLEARVIDGRVQVCRQEQRALRVNPVG